MAGVSLHISTKLDFIALSEFTPSNSYMEWIGREIFVQREMSLLVLIYRPPRGNIINFLGKLMYLLSLAHEKKYDIYILGDLNIDDRYVSEFINLMYSFSLFPE